MARDPLYIDKDQTRLKDEIEELRRVVKINNDRLRWKKNQGVLTKETTRDILKTAKTAEQVRDEYLRISARMGDEIKKAHKTSTGATVETTKRELTRTESLIRRANKQRENTDTVAKINGKVITDSEGKPVHTTDRPTAKIEMPKENGMTQEQIQAEYEFIKRTAEGYTKAKIENKAMVHFVNYRNSIINSFGSSDQVDELLKKLDKLGASGLDNLYHAGEINTSILHGKNGSKDWNETDFRSIESMIDAYVDG